MALWKSLMGSEASAKELADVLAQIDSEKSPIRVEIEGSPVRFRSRLVVKNDTVVVAKPNGLREGIEAGTVVRFRLPNNSAREVLLEVHTPHFNLSSGNAVFLCKVPDSRIANAKRKTERYNVSRYANLHFVIPARARVFRVVDVCMTGCKLLASLAEAQAYFPVGEPMEDSHLRIGKEAKVEFKVITPRSHHRNSVGCEFTVKDDGPSLSYMEHLLNTLEKAEFEQYAV